MIRRTKIRLLEEPFLPQKYAIDQINSITLRNSYANWAIRYFEYSIWTLVGDIILNWWTLSSPTIVEKYLSSKVHLFLRSRTWEVQEYHFITLNFRKHFMLRQFVNLHTLNSVTGNGHVKYKRNSLACKMHENSACSHGDLVCNTSLPLSLIY